MNGQFTQPQDYPFDRYERAASYIPLDSPFDNFYYHACFYGGHVNNMRKLCEAMVKLFQQNRAIGHEPIWNDESLLNFCFHHSKPFRTLTPATLPFVISDKGGLKEMRNPGIELTGQAELFRLYRNKLIDL